jgi:cell division protein FtsL
MAKSSLVIEPPQNTKHSQLYNTETNFSSSGSSAKRNRPVKQRKRSPFNLIFILFVISILIVFYVWNKIIVDRLAVEVHALQTNHQKELSAIESLRAEITRKSSLERIETIAVKNLGLTYPKEQPTWFEVNAEQINWLSEK